MDNTLKAEEPKVQDFLSGKITYDKNGAGKIDGFRTREAKEVKVIRRGWLS